MALGAAQLTGLGRYLVPAGPVTSDYLALAAQISPYLDFLSISGTTYTDLTSEPDTAPSSGTAAFGSCGWDNTGTYYHQVNNVSPYLHIWENTATDEFTKLSAQPAGHAPTVTSSHWSPSGEYIAYVGGKNLTWYSWNGSAATKLTSPSYTGAGSHDWSCAWNDRSDALLVGLDASPWFYYFTRSGTTLTLQSSPFSGTIPPGNATGRFFSIQWSHDGSRVAIGTQGAGVYIYTDNGSHTLTYETKLTTSATGAYSLVWSPDDSLLFSAGGANNSSVNGWSRSGSTYTALTIPTGPGGSEYVDRMAIDMNDDGTLLAIGKKDGNDVHLYSISGTTLTKLSDVTTLSAGYHAARYQNGSISGNSYT